LSPQKVAAIDKTLQHVKSTIAKLDARHRQMLDSYSNVSRTADTWRSFGMQLTDPSFVSRARMAAPL
jgi:archaellum component FlaC